jgi:predicted transcriptional regulator of viral defense system
MRDIAAALDITERAAQRIVADLIRAGYIDRVRNGRRSVYTLRTTVPVELPSKRDVNLGSLIQIFVPTQPVDERHASVAVGCATGEPGSPLRARTAS